MAVLTLAAGTLAGLWLADRHLSQSARSAAGNLSLIEDMTSDWMHALNTTGAAYKSALLAAERRNGIPTYLLARLAWQESRYRADIITGKVKSAAGALGIMQIVPKWHPTMTAADCLNPPKAIDYAAGYLAKLKGQFGTWELALKAYNWGPGNVAAWIQRGKTGEPAETRLYSSQILADLRTATGSAIA